MGRGGDEGEEEGKEEEEEKEKDSIRRLREESGDERVANANSSDEIEIHLHIQAVELGVELKAEEEVLEKRQEGVRRALGVGDLRGGNAVGERTPVVEKEGEEEAEMGGRESEGGVGVEPALRGDELVVGGEEEEEAGEEERAEGGEAIAVGATGGVLGVACGEVRFLLSGERLCERTRR